MKIISLLTCIIGLHCSGMYAAATSTPVTIVIHTCSDAKESVTPTLREPLSSSTPLLQHKKRAERKVMMSLRERRCRKNIKHDTAIVLGVAGVCATSLLVAPALLSLAKPNCVEPHTNMTNRCWETSVQHGSSFLSYSTMEGPYLPLKGNVTAEGIMLSPEIQALVKPTQDEVIRCVRPTSCKLYKTEEEGLLF